MASLEDRISKPKDGQPEDGQPEDGQPEDGQAEGSSASANGTNATAPPFVPGVSESWADETSSAVNTNPEPSTVKAKAEKETSDLAKAQSDGATEPLGGSSGIYEPSYEVDVKLSDIQANPDDPLYSIKSFEELGL